MRCDWRKVKLKEIINLKTGKLDSNAAIENGAFPFFTCSPATLKIDSYAFDEEAVLLAGNNANGVFPVKYYKGKFNAYQRTYVITALSSSVVDMRWLYFQIKFVVQKLQQLSIGSATKFLTKKILDAFEVQLPPIEEQNWIANHLWNIERKISLNTQMNQTLEQMAQALFKSWFVDFDPVIDNALEAGNPIPEPLAERAASRQKMWATESETVSARLSAETRRLFPDRFEEDEVLGWVPERWRSSRLSNISSVLRRGISPKYTEVGGVRVINQKCIRHHEVDFTLCRRNDPSAKKVDGRFLEVGDLLINSTGTGTLGRVAMIEQLAEPTVIDSHVTVVRVDPEVYPKHVFAQQMIFLEPHVTALGEGSTGQTELSRKLISNIAIVMPEFKCLEQLEARIRVFSLARSRNRNQVDVLTQLRDTLLPKLLSGELQLPEAEGVVDTVQETEFA